MRLLVAVLICCVVSTTVRADYDSGVLAYESGRYDIALEEFNLFSERGDPRGWGGPRPHPCVRLAQPCDRQQRSGIAAPSGPFA